MEFDPVIRECVATSLLKPSSHIYYGSLCLTIMLTDPDWLPVVQLHIPLVTRHPLPIFALETGGP